MPQLQTADEVTAYMEAATTADDWEARCDTVKAAHDGHYPKFWYAAIVLSGLVERKAAEFKVSPDITIRKLRAE